MLTLTVATAMLSVDINGCNVLTSALTVIMLTLTVVTATLSFNAL